MNSMEKLAYLKGLVEGLGLDPTKKDTKVITNLIGLLDDVVYNIVDLEDDMRDVKEQIAALDEDLGDLERELYADDDCCCGDHDHRSSGSSKDELCYEVTCPTCGDTIYLDEDAISKNEIDCPTCGEKLEFDLES